MSVYLELYKEKLSLAWPVELAYLPGLDTARIVSSKKSEIHKVGLLLFYKDKDESFRAELAHELIHAYLAERLATIFSSVLYEPDKNFTEDDLSRLFTAQSVIDVWVNDRLGMIEVGLSEADVNNWLSDVEKISDSVFRQAPIVFVYAYALNYAMIMRNDLRRFKKRSRNIGKKLKSVLGGSWGKIIDLLCDYFANLPVLSDELDIALNQYQSATIKVANILRLGIQPEVVKKNEEYYWTF